MYDVLTMYLRYHSSSTSQAGNYEFHQPSHAAEGEWNDSVFIVCFLNLRYGRE